MEVVGVVLGAAVDDSVRVGVKLGLGLRLQDSVDRLAVRVGVLLIAPDLWVRVGLPVLETDQVRASDLDLLWLEDVEGVAVTL